ENFFRTMQEVGVDGITIVDLPIEEAEEVYVIAAKYGVAPIMLISPLTDDARLQKICEYARGYLYLVSRAGVTGLAENYDAKIKEIVVHIRKQSNLPLCIGFGISNPEHGENMINCGADGVIVGSKIIDIINNSSGENVEEEIRQFAASMVEGIARAKV
ncbi:MAG: tryptophan synthase subunit alpha, partial [Cyanobacteria bacterium]|nr:tryptophan synthase subunit alpha [Cyanobacteriota bacterium]